MWLCHMAPRKIQYLNGSSHCFIQMTVNAMMLTWTLQDLAITNFHLIEFYLSVTLCKALIMLRNMGGLSASSYFIFLSSVYICEE